MKILPHMSLAQKVVTFSEKMATVGHEQRERSGFVRDKGPKSLSPLEKLMKKDLGEAVVRFVVSYKNMKRLGP